MTVAAPQASEAGLQAAKEKAGVGDSEAPKEATPGAQEEGPAVDVGSAQALFDAVENNSEKDLEVRGLASPRLLCSTLTSPFSPHPRGLVLFFCVCVILTPLGPPDHPERPRGGRLRRSAGGRARQHRSDSSGAARALGARREASEQPAGQHQQLQPGRGHGLALGVLQGRLEERLGALVPRSSIRGESSCFQKQQQQTFSRLTSFFLSLCVSLLWFVNDDDDDAGSGDAAMAPHLAASSNAGSFSTSSCPARREQPERLRQQAKAPDQGRAVQQDAEEAGEGGEATRLQLKKEQDEIGGNQIALEER